MSGDNKCGRFHDPTLWFTPLMCGSSNLLRGGSFERSTLFTVASFEVIPTGHFLQHRTAYFIDTLSVGKSVNIAGEFLQFS